MASFPKPGATSTEHIPIIATVLRQRQQWTPDPDVMSLKTADVWVAALQQRPGGAEASLQLPATIPLSAWLNQSPVYGGAVERKSQATH